MHSKKGLSAIVATVLILMITIAAIAIVWVAIIPMVKNIFVSSELDANIKINTLQGYTAYDKINNRTIIQLERGQDDVDNKLQKLKFVFSCWGNSHSVIVNDTINEGSAKIFGFNTSAMPCISDVKVYVIGPNSQLSNIVAKEPMARGAYGDVNAVVIHPGNLSGSISGISTWILIP